MARGGREEKAERAAPVERRNGKQTGGRGGAGGARRAAEHGVPPVALVSPGAMDIVFLTPADIAASVG
ncbi:unnamed protein product [Arctogadus glacialis]